MRNRLISAFLVAACAASGWAAKPECDLREEYNLGDKKAQEEYLDKILKKLLNYAGLTGKNKPTLFYSLKPRDISGTPAAAFAPNIGMNNQSPDPGQAKIWVGESIWDFACTDDEIAFILAHEVTHLASDHPKMLDDFIKEVFGAWYDYRESQGLPTSAALFQKENGEKLGKFQIPMEDAADYDALTLMQHAHFDQRGAEGMLGRARSLLGASQDKDPKATHKSPKERQKKIKELVDTIEGGCRAATGGAKMCRTGVTF